MIAKLIDTPTSRPPEPTEPELILTVAQLFLDWKITSGEYTHKTLRPLVHRLATVGDLADILAVAPSAVSDDGQRSIHAVTAGDAEAWLMVDLVALPWVWVISKGVLGG